MTRPSCVPGVDAWMRAEKVSEPTSGTSNSCVLTAMYFRWSKTLKSAPTEKGTARTLISPFRSMARVPPAASSRGP